MAREYQDVGEFRQLCEMSVGGMDRLFLDEFGFIALACSGISVWGAYGGKVYLAHFDTISHKVQWRQAATQDFHRDMSGCLWLRRTPAGPDLRAPQGMAKGCRKGAADRDDNGGGKGGAADHDGDADDDGKGSGEGADAADALADNGKGDGKGPVAVLDKRFLMTMERGPRQKKGEDTDKGGGKGVAAAIDGKGGAKEALLRVTSTKSPQLPRGSAKDAAALELLMMMGRARARTLKAEAGVHESHRTLRGLVCISESVLCYMIALIRYANFL